MSGILSGIGSAFKSVGSGLKAAGKGISSGAKSVLTGSKSGSSSRAGNIRSVTVVDPRVMRSRVGVGSSKGVSPRGVVASPKKASVLPAKPLKIDPRTVTEVSVVDPRTGKRLGSWSAPKTNVPIPRPASVPSSQPKRSVAPVKKPDKPLFKPKAKPYKLQPKLQPVQHRPVKPVRGLGVHSDPFGGLSPQQMKQAGFASAQEYANDAERKARNALRSTPSAGGSREEKGHWGMKTRDFSLKIGGRNRLDPADRDFINEQRDKTHRHKREQFEWEQAPKDRKADRHWNLINTGKVVYRDGKANSDVGAINRELHRDRSLEGFERKFNREWNKRMRTSYYSALSPAEQEAARQDLYSRMRNNHDRSYSIGRAVAGWNADRKAERKQKKEDARNLKNIRMLRGWY